MKVREIVRSLDPIAGRKAVLVGRWERDYKGSWEPILLLCIETPGEEFGKQEIVLHLKSAPKLKSEKAAMDWIEERMGAVVA